MNWKPNMKITAFILMMFLAGIASGQQKPVTGYAPVNGLKMYYEIKGSGEPVVLLHGAFMAVTDVTLMGRRQTSIPMINDFLDAKPFNP
jgi:hypothetical protein